MAIRNHATPSAIRQNAIGLRARVNNRAGVNNSATTKAPSSRLVGCSPKMELSLKEKCSAGPCASRGWSVPIGFTKKPTSELPFQLLLKSLALTENSLKTNEELERKVGNPEERL